MAGTSRYTIRYSDEQVNAIMRAVLIDGHKVAQAIRMAETGQLGVPAFKLDRRYAYQLVKKRREAFELTHPEALHASTTNELRRIHALNLKAARRLNDGSDPAEIAKVAKAMAESLRAIKTTETKTTPKNTAAPVQTTGPNHAVEPNAEANTAPDVLHGLIAKARPFKREAEGARTGSLNGALTDGQPAHAVDPA